MMTLLAILASAAFFAGPIIGIIALVNANRARSEIDKLRQEILSLRGAPETSHASAPAGAPSMAARQPTAAQATPEPISPAATEAAPQPASPSLQPFTDEPIAAPVDTPSTQPVSLPIESRIDHGDLPSLSPAIVGRADEEAAKHAEGEQNEPRGTSVPTNGAQKADAERSFATRWSIWLGGLALAIGGLMIVRYSIEMGYFGPGARLLLGALFAVSMASLSEFIRRREARLDIGGLPGEHIPAVLAGVAVLAGFGVIYAAHAVYALIGPSAAFAMMGTLGIAALTASLLHGQYFGLFGLLGSYVTPVLVGGADPNLPALAIFIAIVTATAFAIEHRRPSAIVIASSIVGHCAWAFLISGLAGGHNWASFLLMALTVVAIIAIEMRARALVSRDVTSVTSTFLPAAGAARALLAALAAPLVLGGILWVAMGGEAIHIVALFVLTTGCLIAAIRQPGFAVLAPLAGAAATGFVLLAPHGEQPIGLSLRLFLDLVRLDIAPGVRSGFSVFAIALALLVSLPLFVSILRRLCNGAADPWSRGALAFAASLTPICIVLAASLRLNGFERTPGFAAIAAALCIIMAVASDLLYRQECKFKSTDSPMEFIASAAFAASASIALGLAVAFALRETWLVTGFALASLGVAVVAHYRPIPLLRSMSAMLGSAALARILWAPILTHVGDLPIVNWLPVIYGVPGVAFALAAHMLSPRRDRALGMAEGLAAFFLGVFVIFEVVQGFVGANLEDAITLLLQELHPLNRPYPSRANGLLALLSLALCGLAIGYRMARHRTASPVIATAERIATVALIPVAIGGLGPFNLMCLLLPSAPQPVIFNDFLFGLVGVGIVFALAARIGPPPVDGGLLKSVLEALALILVSLGTSIVIRHAFAGTEMAVLREGATEARLGYAEGVVMALLWVVLIAATTLWRGRTPSPVLDPALWIMGLLAASGSLFWLGLERNPFLDESLVDGPIVLNRILWGYLPVAVGFYVIARLQRGFIPDLAKVMKLTGTAFAVLTGFLLLRHAFHGPALISDIPITLAEAGFYSTGILAAAFILARQAITVRSVNAPKVAQGASSIAPMTSQAFVAVAISVALLAIVAHYRAPLAGWFILNNAMVGLLAPSALAAMLSLWLQRRGHLAPARIYGVASVTGGLVYALVQVRFLFPSGDWLDDFAQSGATYRLFGYSLAMIAYGVALLAAGLRYQHRDLRLAALAVIALSACKVFLLDLAGLEGLWRAMSFIGLGGCLIGITYLYRWLMPPEVAKP